MDLIDVAQWTYEANEEELAAVASILKAWRSREEVRAADVTPAPPSVVLAVPESGQFGEGENDEPEVDSEQPPEYRPDYGKKVRRPKFKARTNTGLKLPVDRQRAGDPPSQKYAYEPEVPWAKKMWRILLRTRDSGLRYSAAQLARDCTTEPNLVRTSLLQIIKHGGPIAKEKRNGVYVYGVKS